MNLTKITHRVIKAGLVATCLAGLTACGPGVTVEGEHSDAPSDQPVVEIDSKEGHGRATGFNYTFDDGTEVRCIAMIGDRKAGMSCDWEHASAPDDAG